MVKAASPRVSEAPQSREAAEPRAVPAAGLGQEGAVSLRGGHLSAPEEGRGCSGPAPEGRCMAEVIGEGKEAGKEAGPELWMALPDLAGGHGKRPNTTAGIHMVQGTTRPSDRKRDKGLLCLFPEAEDFSREVCVGCAAPGRASCPGRVLQTLRDSARGLPAKGPQPRCSPGL